MPIAVPRCPEPREWLLKKKCTRCEEVKPWAQFSPQSYNEDGSVRNVQSRCVRCQSSKTDAERRAYQRDWARENRARINPRRNARERAKRARISLERAPQTGRRLPVGPFRDWFETVVREHGDMETVARVVVLDPRSLSRALDGTHSHVIERLADQCFTRTGYHLNDFYPETQELAA